jgi:hypothetical protein
MITSGKKSRVEMMIQTLKILYRKQLNTLKRLKKRKMKRKKSMMNKKMKRKSQMIKKAKAKEEIVHRWKKLIKVETRFRLRTSL